MRVSDQWNGYVECEFASTSKATAWNQLRVDEIKYSLRKSDSASTVVEKTLLKNTLLEIDALLQPLSLMIQAISPKKQPKIWIPICAAVAVTVKTSTAYHRMVMILCDFSPSR